MVANLPLLTGFEGGVRKSVLKDLRTTFQSSSDSTNRGPPDSTTEERVAMLLDCQHYRRGHADISGAEHPTHMTSAKDSGPRCKTRNCNSVRDSSFNMMFFQSDFHISTLKARLCSVSFGSHINSSICSVSSMRHTFLHASLMKDSSDIGT